MNLKAPCPETIRTERLLLRRWREEDVEPYARLSNDPHVMRHFHKAATLDEGREQAARLAAVFDTDGFGPWAVEVPGVAPFIGFVGCWTIRRPMPFGGGVEVAWRFDQPHWGYGYAPEAARAALADVFARTDLDEIVAYTSPENGPSRRVMEKLGMTYDPAEDFPHPSVPEDDPRSRTVLYRLRRAAFLAKAA